MVGSKGGHRTMPPLNTPLQTCVVLQKWCLISHTLVCLWFTRWHFNTIKTFLGRAAGGKGNGTGAAALPALLWRRPWGRGNCAPGYATAFEIWRLMYWPSAPVSQFPAATRWLWFWFWRCCWWWWRPTIAAEEVADQQLAELATDHAVDDEIHRRVDRHENVARLHQMTPNTLQSRRPRQNVWLIQTTGTKHTCTFSSDTLLSPPKWT